jgi:hypothetical protein
MNWSFQLGVDNLHPELGFVANFKNKLYFLGHIFSRHNYAANA